MEQIIVREAEEPDGRFAEEIVQEMETAALVRGTGIAKRSPESVRKKIGEKKAVIALTADGTWVGYAYVEVWSGGEFVSSSGLIVKPGYRGLGIATLIKKGIVALAQKTWPGAKIFSITTGLAIMRMNTGLGFEPVTFQEIAQDEEFWHKCSSCVNYPILQGKQHRNCLCTAFLLAPAAGQSVIS